MRQTSSRFCARCIWPCPWGKLGVWRSVSPCGYYRPSRPVPNTIGSHCEWLFVSSRQCTPGFLISEVLAWPLRAVREPLLLSLMWPRMSVSSLTTRLRDSDCSWNGIQSRFCGRPCSSRLSTLSSLPRTSASMWRPRLRCLWGTATHVSPPASEPD